MSGDHKPVPYLKTPFSESHGQFSPDGNWVAYASNESARDEIYVQAFPVNGTKYLVSTSGGNFPRWRRDGKELFYRGLDGRLMAVSVRAFGQGLEFGQPSSLIQITEPTGSSAYPYDIAPDGQKILAMAPVSSGALDGVGQLGSGFGCRYESSSTA
jgi:hypothetical protein